MSARRSLRRPNTPVLVALLVVLAACTFSAFAAVAAIAARENASEAVSAARDGLAAVRSGDDEAAVRALARAEEIFAETEATMSAWWVLPARAVPVVGQHVVAVDTLANHGRQLAEVARDASDAIDTTTLSRDGVFLLDRIEGLAPQAERIAVAMEDAVSATERVQSPWLVPEVADQIGEVGTELTRSAPSARNAADALRVAPELLGAEGPRRYLVVAMNPAESRELGGFTASLGVLTADAGDLEFDSLGRTTALNRQLEPLEEREADDLPTPLVGSRPDRFIQNWTNWPGYPPVAELATDLGPSLVGGSVDGVLTVDPRSLAALLRITGPVTIPETGVQLRPGDAADFLLRGQYLVDDFESDGERKERLTDVAEQVFDRLTGDEIPDPRRVAEVLFPLVEGRRLFFTADADGLAPLLRRVGLLGELDAPTDDVLLVTRQNQRVNKMDAYVTTDVAHEVEVDADGRLAATVTVTVTNTAEASLPDYVIGDGDSPSGVTGLPPTTHRMALGVYTPHRLEEVTVDGEAVGTGTVELDRLFRHTARVETPGGATTTVVFRLSGAVDPGDYALTVLPNATATVGELSVAISLPGHTERKGPLPFEEAHVVVPKGDN